jgi:hypothetical protein
MTNERYLVVSYFVCAALSIALSILVFLILRHPFAKVTAASGKRLSSILRTLFPGGLLFPALLGFVSISYYGCHGESYATVVQDRSFLIAKNQAQISAALLYVAVAILFWNVVVVLTLKCAKKVSSGA